MNTTAEALLASINQVRTEMERFTPLASIRILENSLCLRKSNRPNRVHKVRRWMSDQYHYRIQKKWGKRWGYADDPIAYILPAQKTGFSDFAESCVVMHPILAAQFREEVRRQAEAL